MKNSTLTIALGLVILLISVIFLLRPPSVTNTYVEFHSSIWKISNQCIANHYYDNLTEEGLVFSYYSILEDCEAKHLQDIVVQIYDEDGEQEAAVKAYKLHGLIKKLGGNATFLDSVVLKRADNDEFVMDVTEDIRGRNDEDAEDVLFVPE